MRLGIHAQVKDIYTNDGDITTVLQHLQTLLSDLTSNKTDYLKYGHQ